MRLCQLFKPSPPSTHFFLNKNTRGAVINSSLTVELELSLRISRPRHLGLMKVPVKRQGYLTLVANHRTTTKAKTKTISTCKLRQIRAILWSLLLQSILDIVVVNFERVSLQAQYACILLNPNILKNHTSPIKLFDNTTKLFNAS